MKYNLLQREVAALLEMDTPLFSRIERGERTARKETVIRLSEVLKTDEKDLITLWLADQVLNIVGDDKRAVDALNTALKVKKKH